MNMEMLEKLFFWCMVVNLGVYALTAIGALTMRGLICRIHKRLFGLEEEKTMESVQRYLANFKLLVTVFNFAPWIAIMIIR